MTRRPPHIRFHDRLLAEAVRSYEHDGNITLDDDAAAAMARDAGGDLEQRIVNRARHLPIAAQLRSAIQHLNAILGWVIALGVILAMVLGAATARATLGVDGSGIVNFFWVLGGILFVQSAALLLWIAVFIASLRMGRDKTAASGPSTSISLGSIALGLAQWMMRKLHHELSHASSVQAAARVHGSGPLGRWTFSSITHGLWLAFNVGCLVMVVVLLSARQYTFVWETTILSERHYIQLTRLLAAAPQAAGFRTPDEQQIVQSQRGDASPVSGDAREAWSSLLVGSIVFYGFAPRLLLLGLSLNRRRVARNRFQINTLHPGYARLEVRLADQPHRIKEIHQDDGDQALLPAHAQSPPERPFGLPAIVGVEINRSQSTWPPIITGVQWDDLGFVDTRDDQQRVMQRLTQSDTQPQRLAIVCDLTTTPDRGIARLVHELQQPLTRAPLVLLSGGQALRSRVNDASHVAQRVADWQQLAISAGITDEDIVELDLDHLTDHSASRLAQLINGDDSVATRPNVHRIQPAFDLIVQHVRDWRDGGIAPDDSAAQAELHSAIARLYGNDASNWRKLLRTPSSLNPKELAETLKGSSERMLHLLPERLRRSPRWLAAGALSGALGCVAAAAAFSPIAIAALPTWSLIGAAIAAAVQRSSHGDTSPQTRDNSYAVPVRAAALFSLLLELQGRDESSITRILDHVLDDHEEVIASATDAQHMLDRLRHRFDIALSEADR